MSYANNEIRKMLRESGIDPDANREELETLASAVADAWARAGLAGRLILHAFPELCDELDRLEAATRGSAHRKVKP